MLMPEITPEFRDIAKWVALSEEVQGDSWLRTVLKNSDLQSLPPGRILDLGSGSKGVFQYEASLVYPDAEIVSVAPTFGDKYFDNRSRYLAKDLNEYDSSEIESIRAHIFKGVSAIAQELPFSDESFDLVISHASIPAHLPRSFGERTNDHYLTSIAEALRVVKRLGKVILTPMEAVHKDAVVATLEDLKVCPMFIKTEAFPVPGYSVDNWSNAWHRVIIEKH